MSASVRHTVDRLAEQLRRASLQVIRATDRAGQRVAIEAARIGKEDAPKSLSELTNSIRNEQIGVAFHRVIASAAHARYVHDGTTGGGVAPIEVLRRWVRVANIRPRLAISEDEMLYLIQRKIYNEGSKAQPFFNRALRTSRERMLALVPAAARDAIEVSLS